MIQFECPNRALIKGESREAGARILGELLCRWAHTHIPVCPHLKPQEAKIEFQSQLNINASFQFLICAFQLPFLNLCLH